MNRIQLTWIGLIMKSYGNLEKNESAGKVTSRQLNNEDNKIKGRENTT